jgi:hypothetical protein
MNTNEDCFLIKKVELDIPTIPPQYVNLHGRIGMMGAASMVVPLHLPMMAATSSAATSPVDSSFLTSI